MAPDLGPLCSIGGYSFCEAAHVAERHRRGDWGFHSLIAGDGTRIRKDRSAKRAIAQEDLRF